MKVSISMENFPMLLLDMMVEELHKYLPSVGVEVGGEDTVFVNFATDDVVKAQECIIISDKYHFGGGDDGSSILCGDKD